MTTFAVPAQERSSVIISRVVNLNGCQHVRFLTGGQFLMKTAEMICLLPSDVSMNPYL